MEMESADKKKETNQMLTLALPVITMGFTTVTADGSAESCVCVVKLKLKCKVMVKVRSQWYRSSR